jgi:hypothetical protein
MIIRFAGPSMRGLIPILPVYQRPTITPFPTSALAPTSPTFGCSTARKRARALEVVTTHDHTSSSCARADATPTMALYQWRTIARLGRLPLKRQCSLCLSDRGSMITRFARWPLRGLIPILPVYQRPTITPCQRLLLHQHQPRLHDPSPE